ncbi:MAG: hypothetical protein AAB589_03155, partial [Patescibacteria group bacterium]
TESDVYLQVEASSDNSTFQTLSPRQRISASAFAELASAVSGTGSSSFGTTTPIANSQVTIEATSTTAIPLAIRGKTSQTANLFQVQNALASNLLYINSSGAVFASSTLQVTATTTIYSDLVLSGTTKFNGNTYTWPSSISAGNFLQTDSSGNLTWSSTGASAGGWTDGGTVVSPTASTDLISFAQGSSTQFSLVDRLYVGGTATTSILGNGATSTFAGNIGATGDLAGDQLFLTGATSTAANGFNLSAGCFAVNGTCLSTTANVSSVASNGTLTVSPSTGDVVVSLNLGSTNTWTGTQTFNQIIATDTTTTGLTVSGDYITEIEGAGLIISGNALTVDDVTPAMLQSADFGDFTCNGTTCAVDADAITLATDTTGNFVATVSSSGSITVGNSGSENAAVTVNLNTGNANTWTALQTFGGLLSTASSTITDLTMINATSTSATTTNLAITGLATAAGTFLAINPNGQV